MTVRTRELTTGSVRQRRPQCTILVLIRPESFSVEVGRNYWTGRKSFRGAFMYNGTYYNLSVTDPVARDAFGPKEEGQYPLNDVYLCVSLTEPFEHDDKCHKLRRR